VRHAITTRRIVATVWRGDFIAGDSVAEGREAAWVAPAEIVTLPTSSLVRKAMALLPPR